MTTRQRPSKRHFLLHVTRLTIVASILLLLRLQHAHHTRTEAIEHFDTSYLEAQVRNAIPDLGGLHLTDQNDFQLVDAADQPLGRAILTSPDSDHIIGFSGPTNVMLVVDNQNRITDVAVLSSGDTRDHLQQVIEDESFLNSLIGRQVDQLNALRVDAVSGATLTSLAIMESIRHRLGSGSEAQQSLRFPAPVELDTARKTVPSTERIEPENSFRWLLLDATGNQVGQIVRTSPVADNVIGYQGPSDVLLFLDPQGLVSHVVVHGSYDNEPYVGYVRDDTFFPTLFQGNSLDEIAGWDLMDVEGISGATMTSQSIAEGIILTAIELQKVHEAPVARAGRWFPSLYDLLTMFVLLGGHLLALTRWRGQRTLVFFFRLILIGYLGLTAGHLVSQAMLVGWAQHGIPWQNASGLAALTAAALLVPAVSKRNVYCTHICPHGAVQQLLRPKSNSPWKLSVPRSVQRALALLPGVLLAWCIYVGMTRADFSLVDIEPFDAFAFRVAGWATITIAVVGLIASRFVPMAYCRYGCPTGTLLQFLRFHGRSDRWTRREWFAVLLLLLSIGLFVYPAA